MDKDKIRMKLLELGFSPSSKGTEYIAEAVCAIDEDPNRRFNIMKGVYKLVGDRFGVNPGTVERGINQGVAAAMATSQEEIQKFIKFPPSFISGSYKNSDFLAAFHMAMKRE